MSSGESSTSFRRRRSGFGARTPSFGGRQVANRRRERSAEQPTFRMAFRQNFRLRRFPAKMAGNQCFGGSNERLSGLPGQGRRPGDLHEINRRVADADRQPWRPVSGARRRGRARGLTSSDLHRSGDASQRQPYWGKSGGPPAGRPTMNPIRVACAAIERRSSLHGKG